MRTVIAYALLSFMALVGATALGRFLFHLIDHMAHTVSLVLNVN